MFITVFKRLIKMKFSDFYSIYQSMPRLEDKRKKEEKKRNEKRLYDFRVKQDINAGVLKWFR